MGLTSVPTSRGTRGFSLIELVIVVVIIAIVAAIAIPRLSRGGEGAADASLKANLRALNDAVERYGAEHSGTYPSAGAIANQLTLYTDEQGNTSGARTGAYIFGPYLRAIPAMPSGPRKGATAISTTSGVNVAWIYDPASGVITANTGVAQLEVVPEESLEAGN